MSKVEKVTLDIPEGKVGVLNTIMAALFGEKSEAKTEARVAIENPLTPVLAEKNQRIAQLEEQMAKSQKEITELQSALEAQTANYKAELLNLKADLEEKETLLSQYSGRTVKTADDSMSKENTLLEGFIDLTAEHNQYLKTFVGK